MEELGYEESKCRIRNSIWVKKKKMEFHFKYSIWQILGTQLRHTGVERPCCGARQILRRPG